MWNVKQSDLGTVQFGTLPDFFSLTDVICFMTTAGVLNL